MAVAVAVVGEIATKPLNDTGKGRPWRPFLFALVNPSYDPPVSDALHAAQIRVFRRQLAPLATCLHLERDTPRTPYTGQ